MKHHALYPLFAALLAGNAYINSAVAGETTASEPSIPTLEKEFVDSINKFDKKQIVAILGEPATADDVRVKGSEKVVASIWHYHYINTAADGSYYQTTELDFIDDKVVMVVFLNNDGSDGNSDGQKYELPANKPGL